MGCHYQSLFYILRVVTLLISILHERRSEGKAGPFHLVGGVCPAGRAAGTSLDDDRG
jgi:hypothetical protein